MELAGVEGEGAEEEEEDVEAGNAAFFCLLSVMSC